jgi:hypothetical protein
MQIYIDNHDTASSIAYFRCNVDAGGYAASGGADARGA